MKHEIEPLERTRMIPRTDFPSTSLRSAACIAVLLLAATLAEGKISVIGQWRMGEDDPGRAPLSTLPDRTKDRASPPHDLTVRGKPERSSDTPGSALSTISMRFNPAGKDVAARTFIQTANVNVGLECWAKAESSEGEGFVVYNGDGAVCGYGFKREGNQWTVFFGGFQGFPIAPVEPGKWIHLALVIDEKGTTPYVNGKACEIIPHLPNPPASGVLMVGGQADGTFLFHGSIDEVRLFTFVAGEFQPSDLEYPASTAGAAVPPVSAPSSSRAVVPATTVAPDARENPSPKPEEPGVDWLTDPPTAAAQARASNKKICIFVYSDVAKDCKRTLDETFNQQAVQNLLNSRFVCLKLDPERNSDLMAYFKIYRAGTVLVCTPEGDVLTRIDQSFISAGEIVNALSRF